MARIKPLLCGTLLAMSSGMGAEAAAEGARPGFVDVTAAVGFGPEVVDQRVARVCFVDLDGDGWADLVVDRHRVFLNRPADGAAGEPGTPQRIFAEVPRESTGLPEPGKGSVVVFADVDGDGVRDAIVAESVVAGGESEEDPGRRTRWLPGRGDGTFGEARAIEAAPARTSAAIAAGDVNRDGRLDLYLGNWYEQYGASYAGWPNDLLVQVEVEDGNAVRFERSAMPDDGVAFDEERDAGGRPTYGVLMADVLADRPGPELIELNYGRRWNRLWARTGDGWTDVAPTVAFDGDDIRHGRHPAWLKERAKEDARFDRPDEPPFRANGNTFDAAVGDVDGDGDFDLFIAEITHGWAGESSDRSRFLIQMSQERGEEGDVRFVSPSEMSVDRIPEGVNNWNQGDLFCALADLDHDTRLDLILSSGDYPDNQRLRVYMQQADGTFEDATERIGLDHDGSQQISLADFDGDGDLDLIAGQTFFRYSAEQKAGRQPRPKLFANELTEGRKSLVLRLEGDGERVATDALGAVVRATLPDGRTLVRQLVGIGGHAGKQHDFIVHVGIGEFLRAELVEVVWPTDTGEVSTFEDVEAGTYALRYGGELKAMRGSIGAAAAQHESMDSADDITRQGYMGLALRDIPSGHTVVSWVLPGPLEGQGLASGAKWDLARPDLVVSVDGRAMSAEAFGEYVREVGPGREIMLETRRSLARGGTIPKGPNHEEEVRSIVATTASRDEWIGSVGRASRADEGLDALGVPGPHDGSADAERLLNPAAGSGSALARAIDEHELREPLATLQETFATWPGKSPDPARLQRVRDLFADPFRLPELSMELSEGLEAGGLRNDPAGAIMKLFARGLECAAPDARGQKGAGKSGATIDGLEARLIEAHRRLNDVLAGHELAGGVARAASFLEVPRTTFYIGGPDAKRHIDVIRQSMTIDKAGLLGAFASLAEVARWSNEELSALANVEAVGLPAELRGAVEGEVMHVKRLVGEDGVEVGWLVVGSAEANGYDMTRIAAVIDPGGNDRYMMSGPRAGVRLIVDVAGDDAYEGCAEQGVASAMDGVTLVDDRAGNDRHTGQLLTSGAAMRGVAVLIDRAGADVHEGSLWSQGAACYGAAGLVDLGDENDVYMGDFLCQGVGGPVGAGALIDVGGRDLYRANGPTPSAYGTAAVFQSFSQGMGFGYRGYASGGIGLLHDLAGDDRYEAGEFAQGGAYYYALGVLRDGSGRDLYYGNRYGQGFGVHQAFGSLIDEAGDDTYWSMTAASQGAAWDIGAGLLLDRAGDDSYQCDGLGQGGAAQQAIAMLVDLGGRDRYVAGRSATQGMSGDNRYHHHSTGAYSFSVLMDLGGDLDVFTGPGENGVTRTMGSANEEDAAASRLHGLFIDH